jgi:hypothetical protein
VWVARQPHREDVTAPVRLDEIDVPGLIDRHIEELSSTPKTAESRASIIRRVLLHSRGGRRVAVTNHRSVAVPLDVTEVAVVVQYAHHQRTPTNRRSMCFIVGLSLGAGLDGHDLALVRRRHLEARDLPSGETVLTVTIVDGQSTRVVVVADVLRPTVELAMSMHDNAGRGPDAFILGTLDGRDQVVQRYIHKAFASRPEDRPHVSCPRMRSTWLLGAMQAGIPVPEVLDAAGLTYATTLLRLRPYCDPLDQNYISELFKRVHKNWKWATR